MKVLYFTSSSCGPCRRLSPTMEKLATEFDITKVSLNGGQNQALAVQYGISSVPTLIILDNDEVVAKSVGYKTEEEVRKLIA